MTVIGFPRSANLHHYEVFITIVGRHAHPDAELVFLVRLALGDVSSLRKDRTFPHYDSKLSSPIIGYICVMLPGQFRDTCGAFSGHLWNAHGTHSGHLVCLRTEPQK